MKPIIFFFIFYFFTIPLTFGRELVDLSSSKDSKITLKSLDNIPFFIFFRDDIDYPLLLQTLDLEKYKYSFNKNVHEDEKMFQLLIDFFEYILIDYKFTGSNEIGLFIMTNKFSIGDIGYGINFDLSTLSKLNNRDFSNNDLNLASHFNAVPPLNPLREIFNNVRIVKYTKTKNGVLANYDSKKTEKIKEYLQKHIFIRHFVEQYVEDAYKDYFDIKKNIFSYVVSNNIKEVKRYIKYQLPIDAKNKDGNSLLSIASMQGNVEVADLLLQDKANVHNKDRLGSTPLIYAAMNGSIEMVKLLIKYGANPDATIDGKTALYFAKYQNNNAVVNYLSPLTTVKTSSVTTSSYKYRCKFCCEGQWGSCRSKTIEVNTPCTNPADAQDYVRKNYESMCKKYPFFSGGGGSAAVGYPNCE